MKKSEPQLVIGLGEVGSALKQVLERRYTVHGYDLGLEKPTRRYGVVHICFPYSKKFLSAVKTYKRQYLQRGGLLIIHSTVALGTSRSCGAVHSPIRGIHPHLAEGITTFVKFFGGARAKEAAAIFAKVSIKTRVTTKAETTEALKLWDTTIFGWNILLEKLIADYCRRYKLDWEVVYKEANQTYNEGYAALGRPEFAKYVLKHIPGPVGGHCVMSNCDFLDSEVARLLIAWNKNKKYHA